MVEKFDGTIYSINNIFKTGKPDKLERVIQTQKNPCYKFRKEKAYANIGYDQYVFYLEGG